MGRNWSRSQYHLLHLLVDLDRSGDWAMDGSRTCAHWVGCVLDIEIGTAREWLRIGRLLRKLTLIDAAFEAGRISYSKVRQMTRIATAENESELLVIAEKTPAGRLGHELARWLAGHEDNEDRKRRQRAARSMSWRTEPDGMVLWTVRLPPEMAALPMAAIDAWIMRGHSEHRVDGEPATQSGADASADALAPPRAREWATVAQQRADGLITLLGQGGAVVDTEVVLHVRADGCSLDDGTPIAGSMVERLVPSSFIRLLIHDAERRPINASGRHRHPTTRQKRVVHERDNGCVDCRSTNFLEFDHEPEFAVSGRTVIEELKERCWTCHRARHG